MERICCGVVAALVMGMAAPVVCGQEYVPLAPLNVAREYAACAALNGRVYVVGGLGADGAALASVERYDAVNNRWEFVAPLPQARDHAAAVAPYLSGGPVLFVIGGFAGDDIAHGEVYEYRDSNNSWLHVGNMPEPRGGHAAVDACCGEIMVFGGSAAHHVPTSTVYSFYPGGGGWMREADMPTARDDLAAANAYQLTLYVVGGQAANGPTGAHEAFDQTSRTWHTLASLPTPRAGVAAVPSRGFITVAGGRTPEISAVNEIYTIALDTWQSAADLPEARHGLCAAIGEVAFGCGMFLAGGASGAGLSPTSGVDLFLPPALADWNRDRVINSQDFFDFTNDYFAGHGDFNGNGEVNSQDFFDFLAAFFAGC